MGENTRSITVTVNDPHGMHMRPADLFVRKARGFRCKITLIKDGNRVDGTSILDIMTLAVSFGSQLTIEACGQDADQALEVLGQLIESGFPELQEPKPDAPKPRENGA